MALVKVEFPDKLRELDNRLEDSTLDAKHAMGATEAELQFIREGLFSSATEAGLAPFLFFQEFKERLLSLCNDIDDYRTNVVVPLQQIIEQYYEKGGTLV